MRHVMFLYIYIFPEVITIALSVSNVFGRIIVYLEWPLSRCRPVALLIENAVLLPFGKIARMSSK